MYTEYVTCDAEVPDETGGLGATTECGYEGRTEVDVIWSGEYQNEVEWACPVCGAQNISLIDYDPPQDDRDR